MSIDKLLVINGSDFSEFITERDLSVKYVPVYNNSSDFVSMDGNDNKLLIGYRAFISVDFSYLDDAAAKNLSSVVSLDKFFVTYPFPDAKTAEFSAVSLTVEPVRDVGTERIWSAFLSMKSEVITLDGL